MKVVLLQLDKDLYAPNKQLPAIFCRKVCAIVFMMLFAVYASLSAQPSGTRSIRDVLVTLHATDQALNDIFDQIETVSDFKFVFNATEVRALGKFSISRKNVSVHQVLKDLLPSGIIYEQKGMNILITRQDVGIRSKQNNLLVRGRVTDEAGLPLDGVSVSLANGSRGVVTNAGGEFEIRAGKEKDSLVFSSIGHVPQVIKTGNSSHLTVQLKIHTGSTLGDVVVLGYGASYKRNLSTAVAQLTAEQIGERPSTLNVVQAIAGKIAGVNVMINSGKPGGKPTIKIRGLGSLNTSNSPLYVIDGFIGADPATIDPSIIASVSVLKDAAAAAIYGSRGSNGVIILTTKEGGKDRQDISMSTTISFGTLSREVDLLDAKGALEMLKRQYEYIPGRMAPHLDPAYFFTRKATLFYPDGSPINQVNWQREATRTAVSHNSSLTFSGGKENMNMLANISYKNFEGIMINNYFRQLNGYVNTGWNVKKWLHLQTALNAGAIQQNNIDLNTLGLNPLREMMEFLPFMPVKYEDGTYSRKGDYPGAENSENPVRLLNEVKSVAGRIYTIGNIIGTFHLSPQLDFTTSLSGQLNAGYNFYYAGRNVYDYSAAQQGIGRRSNTIGAAWTNEDYFTYTNRFNKHRLNVIAGASWYYYLSSFTSAGAQNFFDDYFGFNTLQAGSVWEQPSSGTEKNQLNSFYTRASYSYDNKYLLGATLRSDGSSRFGANNQYGFFSSFSAGWIISEEHFFNRLQKAISHFKVRASYGTNGNAAIGNYVTLGRLNTLQVVFNNQLTPAVTVAELGNNNLKWEKARQADMGIDVTLLNGRIELTADIYHKISSDLLYRKQLPATTGYSGAYDNIGAIRNRGVELAAGAKVIARKSFSWNTSLNFAANRSKVLQLNGDIVYTWGGRIMEGRPLNEFFGYIRENAWRTDETALAATYGKKPGDLRWADVNKNNITDAGDRVPLGSGMPRFECNLDNHFTYKGFALFFDMQAMYGHKILNFTRNIDENQAPWTNSYTTILTAWTPQRQNTPLAQLRLPVDGNENQVDSYNMEDGSFLRLRNVAFSYNIREIIKKRRFSKCMVSIIAENYFLLTKYKGYDPENTSFDGELNQGVDFFQYPKAKTISFNLSVGL